jgi:hypothetical protein
MTREEKNKREVLLAGLDAWNPTDAAGLLVYPLLGSLTCTEMPSKATQPQAKLIRCLELA